MMEEWYAVAHSTQEVQMHNGKKDCSDFGPCEGRDALRKKML